MSCNLNQPSFIDFKNNLDMYSCTTANDTAALECTINHSNNNTKVDDKQQQSGGGVERKDAELIIHKKVWSHFEPPRVEFCLRTTESPGTSPPGLGDDDDDDQEEDMEKRASNQLTTNCFCNWDLCNTELWARRAAASAASAATSTHPKLPSPVLTFLFFLPQLSMAASSQT